MKTKLMVLLLTGLCTATAAAQQPGRGRGGQQLTPAQQAARAAERAAEMNAPRPIDAMSSRGVRFAVCDLSTRGMAGMLARSTGRTTEEVYEELVSNAIPSSHFVPAGVMAATRAQEYGYSFMYATE